MSELSDFLKSPEMKEYQQFLDEKEKTVKKGNNVIHLSYLGGLLPEDEIKEIESELRKVNLELSYYDKTGVIYNALDDYSLVIYFAIGQPLITEILNGTITSATWDCIKFILSKTYKKIFGKKSGSDTSAKKVSFGLQVKLDKNTGVNMELKGYVNQKTIENSLGQALDFLREQKLNPEYQIPHYAYFDPQRNKWVKVNVQREIQKKINKKQQKRKK